MILIIHKEPGSPVCRNVKDKKQNGKWPYPAEVFLNNLTLITHAEKGFLFLFRQAFITSFGNLVENAVDLFLL